jgi:hypothetical protein
MGEDKQHVDHAVVVVVDTPRKIVDGNAMVDTVHDDEVVVEGLGDHRTRLDVAVVEAVPLAVAVHIHTLVDRNNREVAVVVDHGVDILPVDDRNTDDHMHHQEKFPSVIVCNIDQDVLAWEVVFLVRVVGMHC